MTSSLPLSQKELSPKSPNSVHRFTLYFSKQTAETKCLLHTFGHKILKVDEMSNVMKLCSDNSLIRRVYFNNSWLFVKQRNLFPPIKGIKASLLVTGVMLNNEKLSSKKHFKHSQPVYYQKAAK